MKAILEFNLPEDEYNHECAMNGIHYKIVLDDMDTYFRGRLKYEDLPNEVRDALQAARDHLHQLTIDIS